MSEQDLGPKPDAEIEPGEPNPGGADAIADSDGVDGESAEGEPLTRDLEPEKNPAVEDALPEEMKQGEDTSTEATRAGKDGEAIDAVDVADTDEDADSDEDAPV